MVEDGVNRKEIWQKTGWWKGKDGKWRVEILDKRTWRRVLIFGCRYGTISGIQKEDK